MGRRVGAYRPVSRRAIALGLMGVLLFGTAACGSAPVPTGTLTPTPTSGATPSGESSVVHEQGQIAAAERLVSSSEVPAELRFDNGYVRAVSGRFAAAGNAAVDKARSFLEENAALYGLDDERLALHVRREASVAGAATSVTFYQVAAGLPVRGVSLTVQVVGDHVLGTVGGLLHTLPAQLSPSFGPAEAEQFAIDAVDAPDGTRILGRATLLIFDASLWMGGAPAPHLAWRVGLDKPFGGQVFVDARDGSLLSAEPFTEAESDTFDSIDLDIEDAENDSSAELDDCYWTSDETEVGDEDGVDDDYANDSDANAARSNVMETYAFYHNKFGRHGWDGDDDEINVYIHALVDNADFAPCSDGSDNIEFSDGWAVKDVAAHEFTHGVVYFTSELASTWPANSLNEGMSDVMAAMVDPDWLMSDEGPDGAVRSMSDPPSIGGSPDRWSERQMSEYPDTGISSKAVFLLTDGGTHPDTGVVVDGIGRQKVARIFYFVLQSLPSDGTFQDLRDQAVITAEMMLELEEQFGGLFWPVLGYTEDDVCQVRNAFGAVELGNPDQDCDGQYELTDWDGDGVTNISDNCELTANVDQDDHDDDGIGNLCDPDWLADADGDGVKDFEDNCIFFFNPEQTDVDGDGVGVPCDVLDSPDADGDGLLNENDNCPLDKNAGQEDVDSDGDGDACDPDTDGDGHSNDDDICPFTSDPAQDDGDGDGIGDACDECPADAQTGVAWTTGIPELGIDPQPLVPDADQDGVPDACDPTPYGNYLVVPDSLLGRGGLDAQVQDRVVISFEQGDADVPILVCDPAPCFDAPPPGSCIELDIGGAPSGISVSVVDDRGAAVASVRESGDHGALRFQPKGGRDYWLTLLSRTGGAIETTLEVWFSPCTVEADSRPEDPDAVPSASPTTIPTAVTTAVPSPTAGSLPSPTATPSPTPRTQPTRTPTAMPTRTPTPTRTTTFTPTPTPTPTRRPTPTPTQRPTPTPCVPSQPRLVEPGNEATIDDVTPQLGWEYGNTQCPPDRQRVQIALDEGMSDIVEAQGLPGSDRSWTAPALENCQTYYWRVTPFGVGGNSGPVSNVWSFFIRTTRVCP